MSGSLTALPSGLTYTAALAPSLNLLLIGTALSATLLPITVSLLFFSNPRIRRQPVFILNMLILIFGFILGAVNIFNQTRLSLRLPVPPMFSLAFAILVILVPMLADSILLLRVMAVYPPNSMELLYLLIIYGPVVLIKVARATVDISFIVVWCKAVFLHTEDPFQAAQMTWETPFPKLAWSFQLVDSTYASTVFLMRLARGSAHAQTILLPATSRELSSTGTTETKTSFYDRLRTLFWISVSNFVFPVIFNLVQLILAFRNPQFLNGTYVMLVNYYVEIFGLLFATIWSTGTKYGRPISSHPMDELHRAETGITARTVTVSPRFARASVDSDALDSTDSAPKEDSLHYSDIGIAL